MKNTHEDSPFGAQAASLQVVDELCRRLERAPVKGTVVAGWLGDGAQRAADVLRLRPRVAAFAEASVQAPAAEGGTAEVVSLTLSQPGALSLEQLEARWGEGSNVPMLHPGEPQRVAFYPDAPQGSPFECAIFALIQGDDPATAKVIGLDLRVDPA